MEYVVKMFYNIYLNKSIVLFVKHTNSLIREFSFG